MLYTESTRCTMMNVDYSIHPLKRWTKELLKQRQEIDIEGPGLGNLKIHEYGPYKKTPDQTKRDLINNLSDQVLHLSTTRCEVEVQLIAALQQYPGDPNLSRICMDFASIFKNSTWEDPQHNHQPQSPTATPESTPKSNSGIVVYHIGSTSTGKPPIMDRSNDQSNSSLIIFTPRVEPMKMRPLDTEAEPTPTNPTFHDTTTLQEPPYEVTQQDFIKDCAHQPSLNVIGTPTEATSAKSVNPTSDTTQQPFEGMASTECEQTNPTVVASEQEVHVSDPTSTAAPDDAIPTFDLGISPVKDTRKGKDQMP